MLHLLLERGIVPDEVVSFECEWDFPQMVAHRKLVEEKTGLHIIMVRNYRHFNDLLRHYLRSVSRLRRLVYCLQTGHASQVPARPQMRV